MSDGLLQAEEGSQVPADISRLGEDLRAHAESLLVRRSAPGGSVTEAHRLHLDYDLAVRILGGQDHPREDVASLFEP